MKRLALAMLLCACGNDNSHHGLLVDAPAHDVDADTSSDAGPPGPNIVTVTSYGSMPDYIAYRDGTGAWATPAMTGQGVYQLKVQDAYELVAVCLGDSGAIDAEEIAATFSTDGGTNYFFCSGAAGGPPNLVAVTGQMTQAGSIFFEQSTASPTANWTFNLSVDPGTHDLIAVDASTIAITRDQAVTAAETLPAIDLSVGGTALASVPIAISGSQVGDTVGTEIDLATANDYDTSVLTTATATLELVPDALLTANDREYISAYDESGSYYRVVETLDPTLTTFPLLPQLTGITFAVTAGTVQATWTTLPVVGSTQLVAFGTGTTSQIADMTVTPSWLAAMSSTSLAIDVSAPGWMPAWSFWTTSAHAESLSISQSSQTQYASTSISDFGTSSFAKRIAKQRQRALRMHRGSRVMGSL
jgi:hypothetical protein